MKKDSSKDLKQPVTRWELIDAISKLYVIQSNPQQLREAVNKSEKPCCNEMRMKE